MMLKKILKMTLYFILVFIVGNGILVCFFIHSEIVLRGRDFTFDKVLEVTYFNPYFALYYLIYIIVPAIFLFVGGLIFVIVKGRE